MPYIFVNPSARVVSKNLSSGLFVVENLELKEGQPNGITFTYDAQTNPSNQNSFLFSKREENFNDLKKTTYYNIKQIYYIINEQKK